MNRFLACLALCLGLLAPPAALAQVTPNYALLSNAAASGPSVAPNAGNYLLNVNGTFGGATLTLVETFNGAAQTILTLTGSTFSQCLAVPSGASLQMVVTGGTPSGLNALLGSVGPGGCSGTPSAGGLPAGTNNIGRSGWATDVAGTGITTRPNNTTTYTANTAWANATSGATYGTFAGVCPINGGSITILNAGFVDQANQSTKLQGTLFLFTAPPTVPLNDNATFNVASADLSNLKTVTIPFAFGTVANQNSGASGSVVVNVPVNAQVVCGPSTQNIYFMEEVNNAYVPVANEVLTPSLHVVATN